MRPGPAERRRAGRIAYRARYDALVPSPAQLRRVTRAVVESRTVDWRAVADVATASTNGRSIEANSFGMEMVLAARPPGSEKTIVGPSFQTCRPGTSRPLQIASRDLRDDGAAETRPRIGVSLGRPLSTPYACRSWDGLVRRFPNPGRAARIRPIDGGLRSGRAGTPFRPRASSCSFAAGRVRQWQGEHPKPACPRPARRSLRQIRDVNGSETHELHDTPAVNVAEVLRQACDERDCRADRRDTGHAFEARDPVACRGGKVPARTHANAPRGDLRGGDGLRCSARPRDAGMGGTVSSGPSGIRIDTRPARPPAEHGGGDRSAGLEPARGIRRCRAKVDDARPRAGSADGRSRPDGGL